MVIEIILFIFALGTDLLTKKFVFLLDSDERHVILKNVFSFELTTNSGAAFGIFSDKTTTLTGITLVFCTFIFCFLVYDYFISKKFKDRRVFRAGFVLILAGGLGNIYDRARLGFVRDFIVYDFIEKIIGKPFAIGNIADVFATVGVILVIVGMFTISVSQDIKDLEKKSYEE